MKQSELRRYRPLYRYAERMGAGDVLRRHLGLDPDFVLPLAVSHGIDFGCYKTVQDLYSLEPIYWAYNQDSFEIARRVKPSLLIPHPLLLALGDRRIARGEGVLVVGPPPGPANDRALADLLDAQVGRDVSILVKPFPGFEKSAAFWRSRGYKVVSLGDGGPPSYDRVIDLFARFELFVGGTVSSALFMAAALGKPVQLLENYEYEAFESVGIHDIIDFASPAAAGNVRILASGDTAAASAMARSLLGGSVDSDPERIRADLESAIVGLDAPLYCQLPYPRFVRSALTELAARWNRPGLVAQTLPDIVKGRLRREVLIHRMNEVAMFSEGPNARNFRVSRTRHRPGVTEPGAACDWY